MNATPIEAALTHDREMYRKLFLEENKLEEFIPNEKRWVENNLKFIFSTEQEDVILKVNPYHQLIKYNLEVDDENESDTYLLMPKYLFPGELYIYAGPIKNADQFIKTLINIGGPFNLSRLIEQIAGNHTGEKSEELRKKTLTIVRKFLSYQYLVID